MAEILSDEACNDFLNTSVPVPITLCAFLSEQLNDPCNAQLAKTSNHADTGQIVSPATFTPGEPYRHVR